MASRKDTVRKARSQPVTAKQVSAEAKRQIWQNNFNPDYDQVVMRISTAPLNGLRNGQPPPNVT